MIPFPFVKKWRAQESVGLDFGSRQLKWIRLQTLGPGRLALVLAESLPSPDSEQDWGEVLQSFVARHRLRGLPAAVALQSEHLHIRSLELPKMPKEDLIEAIRWQMRDIAEGAMEDYAISFSMVEEKTLPEIVHYQLLGFAMKREAIQKYVHLLERAGLAPFFVEPLPVTLAAALERAFPMGAEGTAAVDLGFRHPFFFIVKAGKLQFVRPLPGLVGQSITAADYPSHLSVEIQNALDAYSLTAQAEKIAKVFLAGGGAQRSDLPALVSQNIGVAVAAFDPFAGIERKENFPKAQQQPFLFGAAVGAALLKP